MSDFFYRLQKMMTYMSVLFSVWAVGLITATVPPGDDDMAEISAIPDWGECANYFLQNCENTDVLDTKEFKRLCGKGQTEAVIGRARHLVSGAFVVGCMLKTVPNPIAETMFFEGFAAAPGELSNAQLAIKGYRVPKNKVNLENKPGKGFNGNVETQNQEDSDRHLVFRVFLEKSGSRDCFRVKNVQDKDNIFTLDLEDRC